MSDELSTQFNEQEYIVLLYRIREQWDSGVLPPRHELSRFLHLCTGLLTEAIGQRQRANKAERRAALLEQGQELLFRMVDAPAASGARACTPSPTEDTAFTHNTP